ncbi:zinc finger MYND domain-containing protein [Sporobolomyces salmoneus]|uniref:zinc finger MYND domain-containing protein n=1 Tax=Sporobolomyces salmoneus TaxID=183962 RepID=UPI00317D9BAF
MTSAANSGTLLGGECVVCGKKTTLRCSACSKAGLGWMFFCSIDHQELIWKVHKRVCGKAAFEWPALNDEEVQFIWELRDKFYDGLPFIDIVLESGIRHVGAGVGGLKLSETVRPKETREGLFLALLHNTGAGPLNTRNDVSRFLRSYAFQVPLFGGNVDEDKQEAQVEIEDSIELVVKRPFDFMAYLLESEALLRRQSTAARNLASSAGWYSIFQHRFLILIAVLGALASRQGGPPPLTTENLGYFKHTMNACKCIPSPDSSRPDIEILRRLFDKVGQSSNLEMTLGN